MTSRGSEACAIDLWLKRRRPAERRVAPEVSDWVLLVCYRAGGNEYATRLGLSSDRVAQRVDRLLAATRMGSRNAARALFACLHAEWGQAQMVRRDLAWDAVFRYLAPLAAGRSEPDGDYSPVPHS